MSTSNFIGCEYENIIRSEIANANIKNKINDVVGRNKQTKSKSRVDKTTFLETLRNEGVVDEILNNLLSKFRTLNQNNIGTAADKIFLSYAHQELAPPGPGQFLSITLVKGSNFAEHLLSDSAPVNDQFEFGLQHPDRMRTGFQFFLAFQKQRLSSKMIGCVRDPLIGQQFFVKITDGDPETTSVSTLLGLREPLHMVVVKRNNMSNERWLVSSQVVEWRMVLCSDSWSTRINMDLQGVFEECKVNIGSIELVLQLVPSNHRDSPVSQEVFNAQLRMENVTYGSEKERKFLVYAKQWWQEFNGDHVGDERLVKIFAQDENGLNRFVCDYVTPLRAGRILDSPCQAARFVASMPTQSSSSIGSLCGIGSSDLWKSGLAFLVENRGGTENHALLLCSLLLGFGINAFVAVGMVKDESSTVDRPHSWVVTFQENQPNRAVFWEAGTGKKYSFHSFPHYSVPANQKFEYRSIGCLFNHYQFFANNFKNRDVEMCIFDMNNPNRWKPMSEEVIAIVVDNRHFEKAVSSGPGGANISWNNRIPLSVSRLVPPCSGSGSDDDPIKTSNDLESQLRTLMARWRSARLGSNVVTRWDDQLCYVLGQALFSYELDQLTGISNVGNDEFKAAIQRHVRDGHTFKAFPLHVSPVCLRYVTGRITFWMSPSVSLPTDQDASLSIRRTLALVSMAIWGWLFLPVVIASLILQFHWLSHGLY